MRKILTTKFSHWSYEEEWRQFIPLDKNAEEKGLYYSDFSNDLKLKQVIIGAHSKLTRKQVSNALTGLNKDIVVFKARVGFKKFEVVKNQRAELWA
ncbi:MAG: hypothetical protein V7721_11700 [Porticoccaceae bacterium]